MESENDWLKKVLGQFGHDNQTDHNALDLALKIHDNIAKHQHEVPTSWFDVLGAIEILKTLYNFMITNSFYKGGEDEQNKNHGF